MADKKFLEGLSDFSEEFENARKIYEHNNDTWWNGLTEQEREDAFYAVVKRIHKAELQDRGSYRWALYDVFGFDPGMYVRGMDCGYMDIHNAIFDGEDLQVMKRVNRFEVIDEEGRTYVNHLNDSQRVQFHLQDDGKTLKVFIDSESWKSEL